MLVTSIHMALLIASGRLYHPKRTGSEQISHLLADDMLVFCRADRSSFKELNYWHLLETTYLNTGLSINRDKSRLLFSKGCKLKFKRRTLFHYWHFYWPSPYQILGASFETII